MIIRLFQNFFTIEESAGKGRARDKIRGIPLNQPLHDMVVRSAHKSFFCFRVVALHPIMGVHKAALDACKPRRQKHKPAVKQFMGMDNIVLSFAHYLKKCAELPEKTPSIGSWNTNTLCS